MNRDAVIQTENLSKVYGYGKRKITALHKLNIEIYKGEIFGILGPNGSGKTTTMKLLLGLLFPTEGKALVLNEKPTSVKAKSKIGFLPEESYLYKFLNAEETLDFYGRLFNIPSVERKKRINKLIGDFGLEWARKRRLSEYSKGMIRRVSFAQALINDPEVIFLDEPTSGLDPISSRQIKDMMLSLKKQGKTIFLSSHLLADVQDVCDRIAILHEGKLKRYGTVDELLVDKDSAIVALENVSQTLKEKIKNEIELSGGKFIEVGFKTESLENLFLKVVKGDSDGGSGSTGHTNS